MAERSLKDRALALLARRDHSCLELRRKLATHGEAAEIEEVLARLQELGLLSEQRFANARAGSRSQRFGDRRIRHDLQQAGVSSVLIEEAVTGLAQTELERARSVWQKKFGEKVGARPQTAQDYARQARFLSGRGFGADTVRRVLREMPDDAPDNADAI